MQAGSMDRYPMILTKIVSDIAHLLRCHDVVDPAPFLRQHVAEQINPDRAGCRLCTLTVALVQLGAYIAVELLIQRPHLGFVTSSK